MASLKEIKGRINSINGTLKITSAMKMVASAKLHKAQTAIANLLPYRQRMYDILYRLISDDPLSLSGRYTAERQARKVAIVAVASNSSLCGAFNSDMIRFFGKVTDEYLASGLSKEDILVFPVGRKMSDAVSKAGFRSQGQYDRLADKHLYDEVAAFAQELTDRFLKGEVDRVELLYSHYKSSAVQEPVRETYLPFLPVSASDAPAGNSGGDNLVNDYIKEPDAATLLNVLLPKVLVLQIYTMLLDANLSEHAARTVAMQEASDNGRQLLQDLTLQYNKQRQQAITNELLDIVSGTMA